MTPTAIMRPFEPSPAEYEAIVRVYDGANPYVSGNEENNPMFDLNLRLGFQAQPADVDWEKQNP